MAAKNPGDLWKKLSAEAAGPPSKNALLAATYNREMTTSGKNPFSRTFSLKTK